MSCIIKRGKTVNDLECGVLSLFLQWPETCTVSLKAAGISLWAASSGSQGWRTSAWLQHEGEAATAMFRVSMDWGPGPFPPFWNKHESTVPSEQASHFDGDWDWILCQPGKGEQLKTPSTLNVFWMSSLDNRHGKLNMAKIRLLTFLSDRLPLQSFP